MSYRIAQDFEYVGNDYWRWSAWIEAASDELDAVKKVVWILHPTFKRPQVVATQRSDKFRLNTAGWGTFLLKAEVVLKDGHKQVLKHNLRLEYQDASADSPPTRSGADAPERRTPTIYLSYSTQDARVAAKLRAGFETIGFAVLDQTQVGPGEPWSETVRRMMTKSDAVVGLICEDETSPWVSDEIKAALALSKPALALLGEGASSVGLPEIVRKLTIDVQHFNPTAIAELLHSDSETPGTA